ncbi:MAG TPA: sigma-70 family RNA polymerase sigma factor [Anaerolineales bacterium]
MPTREEQQFANDLRTLDARALAAVYDQYSDAVYKYVRYRLGDDGLAEDVASEVFVSLLESVRRGAGPQTNVRGWLLSTAGHIVTDHIRRSYRRPTESLDDEHPDPAPLPGEEFESRERTRRFRTAYSRLTAEQQHVLALRFGEGYSLEETAAVINKNVNAVKALQFRAMQALQRVLGEPDHEDA